MTISSANKRWLMIAMCLTINSLKATAQTETPSLVTWPGFLGPGGNPVVAHDIIPERIGVRTETESAINIAWRREIPGRCVSGPVIVDGKVFTTSSSSMEGRWMHLSAVSAESGKIQWLRSLRATGRPFCHPTSANAAPTPCTDGRHVYAFFSSNDLACYDLRGNLVWYRSLVEGHPLVGNDVGMSSSPVVVDGVLVATAEAQADSFTIGLDATSGKTLWEIARPRKANWSSPRVATGQDGKHVVVIHSASNAIGIDPATGRVAWELDQNCSTVASAVFFGGSLYLPSNGVQALRLTKALEQPSLDWKSSKINPSSSSLLVVDNLGVIGMNRSILVCCDFSGELRWQLRLPDAGQFWATPLVAGRRLIAIASDGKCFIVDLKEDAGEIVSQNDLGVEVLGSPAADDQALYIRSVDSLWKIQKQAIVN